MEKRSFKNWINSRVACVAGIFLFVSLATGPAMGAEGIDPDADAVLQAMSKYLGGTKAFSMKADIDFEVMGLNGQKLQLSSLATVVMERPEKFHITRKGLIADAEFIFDGETLTLYGKNLNVYSRTKVPGNIDNAIVLYEMETGIPAPGADLLFSDPYAVLSTGVESGDYVGVTYINGVECHHLAFREAKTDWQIWISTGDKPLPMKYVITSKWQTGAPQYELRLRDWNTNPKIKGAEFAFAPPQDARRVDIIPAAEMEEFTTTGEGQ